MTEYVSKVKGTVLDRCFEKLGFYISEEYGIFHPTRITTVYSKDGNTVFVKQREYPNEFFLEINTDRKTKTTLRKALKLRAVRSKV